MNREIPPEVDDGRYPSVMIWRDRVAQAMVS